MCANWVCKVEWKLLHQMSRTLLQSVGENDPFSQFHQYCLSSFCDNIHLPQNENPKIIGYKKEQLVKCWWNWPLPLTKLFSLPFPDEDEIVRMVRRRQMTVETLVKRLIFSTTIFLEKVFWKEEKKSFESQ